MDGDMWASEGKMAVMGRNKGFQGFGWFRCGQVKSITGGVWGWVCGACAVMGCGENGNTLFEVGETGKIRASERG